MRNPGPRLLVMLAAVLAAVGVAVLALSGAAAVGWSGERIGPAIVADTPAGPRGVDRSGTDPAQPVGAPAPLEPSRPVSLDIPAIGVHTTLLTLGLDPAGAVEVPPLESPEAGWYEYSPTPGERGPAVVLGHVDSARTGAGVFFALPTVRAGDLVTVGREDGSTVAFRVDRVARYPKAAFPTEEVYGDLDHPGLRLITCGGAFDQEARSYLDNVVVFASAVAPGHAG